MIQTIPDISAKDHRAGWAERCALVALCIMLVSQMTVRQFPDPDMYHEMASWRYALQFGHLPVEDSFAYTPTRPTVIHHEWGTGAILYYVLKDFGASGLLLLRYGLTAFVALLAVQCARRRGAGWPAIIITAPLAIFLGHIGLTTVRAQLFTLVFMAALLLLLEADRRGKRWWIVPWLVAYVLWLNLHAGFVVGIALFGAYWFEQIIRTRQMQWRLGAVALSMAALTLANPYGWRYLPFVWESAGMDRPMIPEWWPLWRLAGSDALPLYVFIFAAMLLLYVVWRAGLARASGILILALCAYGALRHLRHASLFAVALLCYMPGMIQTTPLGDIIDRLWRKHARVVGTVAAAIGLICLFMMPGAPWRLYVPVSIDDEDRMGVFYPVGAVQYLRDIGFRGNLMTPFVQGAYVSWHLWPSVKVSQDGRYEVAYQPGVVEEMLQAYAGKEGWRETLEKYPTDAVLVPHHVALAKFMADTNWTRFYSDDAVAMYARPGLNLPVRDATHQPLAVQFP